MHADEQRGDGFGERGGQKGWDRRERSDARSPLSVACPRSKYRLDAAEPVAVTEEKISKDLLVRRLKAMTRPGWSLLGLVVHCCTSRSDFTHPAPFAAATVGSRLDIPKWLERYTQCFQVPTHEFLLGLLLLVPKPDSLAYSC